MKKSTLLFIGILLLSTTLALPVFAGRGSGGGGGGGGTSLGGGPGNGSYNFNNAMQSGSLNTASRYGDGARQMRQERFRDQTRDRLQQQDRLRLRDGSHVEEPDAEVPAETPTP